MLQCDSGTGLLFRSAQSRDPNPAVVSRTTSTSHREVCCRSHRDLSVLATDPSARSRRRHQMNAMLTLRRRLDVASTSRASLCSRLQGWHGACAGNGSDASIPVRPSSGAGRDSSGWSSARSNLPAALLGMQRAGEQECVFTGGSRVAVHHRCGTVVEVTPPLVGRVGRSVMCWCRQ